MLFLLHVQIRRSPLLKRNKFSNNTCPIYPLSAHTFPLIFQENCSISKIFYHPHLQVKHKIQNFTFIIETQIIANSRKEYRPSNTTSHLICDHSCDNKKLP